MGSAAASAYDRGVLWLLIGPLHVIHISRRGGEELVLRGV